MKTIWNWLEGKKTYISAALLALCACYASYAGQLNDVSFMTIIAVACAFVGLGNKADRYGKVLKDALDVMREVRANQPVDLKELVADVTSPGAPLPLGMIDPADSNPEKS